MAVINDLADALGVSRGAAVGIAILIAIQVVVQLAALVDLARRPAAMVQANKWIWALVILLGNLAGAVIYFAVGRRVQEPVRDTGGGETETGSAAERTRRAADLLYGPDDRR